MRVAIGLHLLPQRRFVGVREAQLGRLARTAGRPPARAPRRPRRPPRSASRRPPRAPARSTAATRAATSASVSSARWLIATTAGSPNVSRTVVEVPDEVDDAALERGDVLARQVGDLDAAVVLHRAHRRDDHGGRGAQPRRPAEDVDELLGAEVGAESRLGHDVVGEVQRGIRGEARVAAVRDVRERTAVHERRGVLEGLHEVGGERVAQHRGHRAVRAEVARAHRLPVARVADDDVAETLLEVVRGRSRGRRSP